MVCIICFLLVSCINNNNSFYDKMYECEDNLEKLNCEEVLECNRNCDNLNSEKHTSMCKTKFTNTIIKCVIEDETIQNKR